MTNNDNMLEMIICQMSTFRGRILTNLITVSWCFLVLFQCQLVKEKIAVKSVGKLKKKDFWQHLCGNMLQQNVLNLPKKYEFFLYGVL